MEETKNSNEETIRIQFPDRFYDFEKGKPVVLLGANGAGKTRLGVEIEKLNDPEYSGKNFEGLHVKRITPHKALSIPENIIIIDLESAKNNFNLGPEASKYAAHISEEANKRSLITKESYRYKNKGATHLVDDFADTLSYFFADYYRKLEEEHDIRWEAQELNNDLPDVRKSNVKQVEDLWNAILPKRELILKKNKVNVKVKSPSKDKSLYPGDEMSSGERIVLYIILQVLLLEKDSVLIIDEPEQHIHNAILNKLWDKLEEARPDCLFIYITHNLEFAVSRNASKVFWIKTIMERLGNMKN